MRKFFIVALVSIITFNSCKKDSTDTKSNTVLLTSKGWVLKAYTQVRISDGASQDAFAPMSACYRDDIYTFKADNTYEGSVGALKCDPSQPQVFQAGTWRFDNNETILERNITSGNNISVTRFSVTSLTATELKLQISDGSYNHIATYSH